MKNRLTHSLRDYAALFLIAASSVNLPIESAAAADYCKPRYLSDQERSHAGGYVPIRARKVKPFIACPTITHQHGESTSVGQGWDIHGIRSGKISSESISTVAAGVEGGSLTCTANLQGHRIVVINKIPSEVKDCAINGSKQGFDCFCRKEAIEEYFDPFHQGNDPEQPRSPQGPREIDEPAPHAQDAK